MGEGRSQHRSWPHWCVPQFPYPGLIPHAMGHNGMGSGGTHACQQPLLLEDADADPGTPAPPASRRGGKRSIPYPTRAVPWGRR